MSMKAALTLVNANEMRPPVGPIALDYLGSALEAAGFEVSLLDLTWADSPEEAVASHFRCHQPLLVGFTLRNTDDCYLAGGYSCLPYARSIISFLRKHTDAPVVVGGCGFSIMPRPLFHWLAADYGIAGDGEQSLVMLAHALDRGEGPCAIPGLVYRTAGGDVICNLPQFIELNRFPLSRRPLVDNARYWREGGQGGFETKRGCDGACIYCADPLAKGRVFRLRNPRDVAREVVTLSRQGVLHLHTCDAEFNRPRDHAIAVCSALIEVRADDRVQWWAYCSPAGFDAELAVLMKKAGCVGVDFGADHGCDEQLVRLGRDHRTADLHRVARLCHQHGLVFMFDLLLGAPGETRETVRRTIELMNLLNPSCVGIALGVRLYPGTPLATRLTTRPLAYQPGLVGELENNDDLTKPVFYVAPELGPDPISYVAEIVNGDQRFFCPDPATQLTNYNYRNNAPLMEAIRKGYRGAYWDILRRVQENLPPA